MNIGVGISSRKIRRLFIALVVCATMVMGSLVAFEDDSFAATTPKMKVTSAGIKDGYIAATYCYTDSKGNPVRKSLPLKITNAPKKAKYFAVYMYDTASVAKGFVHWTAANYKSKVFSANASTKKAKQMVQGRNDFGFNGYGAPTPPAGTGTHTYVIKVYALKSKISLKSGFSYSEFKKAVKGKVLATATVKGKCKPQSRR